MRKSVTNRIIKYSLNEKKNLTIGMVFTVLMTVFEIIGPIILAYIINNLLTGEKLVYNIRKLALVLCLYAAVFFVDSLWKYNSTVYLEKTANKIARRMQMDVYDHIQKMPISFYDNLPAGKVVSRITNDTKTVKSFYQMVLAQLMVSVIVSIFMIAMVLITDTKIGIIVCLFFPIMFYIFKKFLQKSRFAFTNMRKYISEENAKIKNILKQKCVNLLQTLVSTNLKVIDKTLVPKLNSPPLRQKLLINQPTHQTPSLLIIILCKIPRVNYYTVIILIIENYLLFWYETE